MFFGFFQRKKEEESKQESRQALRLLEMARHENTFDAWIRVWEYALPNGEVRREAEQVVKALAETAEFHLLHHAACEAFGDAMPLRRIIFEVAEARAKTTEELDWAIRKR